MKKLKLILLWLSISFLFMALPIFVFSRDNYYLFRYDNTGVYEEFELYEIDRKLVDKNSKELTTYLSPFGNYLDEDFFSDKDIKHLHDVKNIMIIIYSLTVVSLFIIIVNIKNLKQNYHLLAKYCKYYLLTTVTASVLIILNFDYFFTKAHELVFFNDYWLLDPTTSNLIKMFPQQVFFEVFLLIIISNILLHLSFIMLYKLRYAKSVH